MDSPEAGSVSDPDLRRDAVIELDVVGVEVKLETGGVREEEKGYSDTGVVEPETGSEMVDPLVGGGPSMPLLRWRRARAVLDAEDVAPM